MKDLKIVSWLMLLSTTTLVVWYVYIHFVTEVNCLLGALLGAYGISCAIGGIRFNKVETRNSLIRSIIIWMLLTIPYFADALSSHNIPIPVIIPVCIDIFSLLEIIALMGIKKIE